MNGKILFSLYLIIINIVAVAVTVSDKRKAVRHKWRVKETTLMVISALGGSAAMFLTMKLIHHKTQKPKFMIGIPAIFIVQILLWYVFTHFEVVL